MEPEKPKLRKTIIAFSSFFFRIYQLKPSDLAKQLYAIDLKKIFFPFKPGREIERSLGPSK
jgi:hypothetical protein